MKIIKSTLVALAIISTSAVGALAHDGEPSQSGLNQTGQDTTDLSNKDVTNRNTLVKVVSPRKKEPTPSASQVMNQNAHESK